MRAVTGYPSRRRFLACAAGAVVIGPRLARAETRESRIETLQEFYAKTYGEPLSSTERLPRQIAIVSLARIDSPQTTQRLLDVLGSKERDPLILYLAWEALHARHTSLTPEQKQPWVSGGLKGALHGAFPESTVAPLLLALSEHDPVRYEAEPGQLALRVIQENDLGTESGKAALESLRQLVAAWHDPRLVRALIGQLSNKKFVHLAKRIDYVLRGLPNPPPEGEDPRKAWNPSGSRVAGLKTATAAELKPYSGKATAFKPPEKIVDPDDKRWRAELEISKLTVSDFDLAWCIDSTGSMNQTNQLVAKETGLVLRVCALVSKRARCGAIYFRHDTDPALMQRCCQEAKSTSGWYQVKSLALTDKVAELSTKMAAERIPRPAPQFEGNVHPGGAFHAVLRAAMDQMAWSKDRGARKAIVLVGDSMVTPGSEEACTKLVADATSKGFQVHALVKGRAMATWGKLIEPRGEIFPFVTAEDLEQMEAADRPIARRRRMMASSLKDMEPRAVFARVTATVIRALVTPAYQDRIQPLVNVLLPYAEATARAERSRAGEQAASGA